MKQHKNQRQRVMVWRLKMATMIEQAYQMGIADSDEETEALQTALLEMAISGFLTREDQTGTMTALNQIMYDIFDAENDPCHWRREEDERMVEIMQDLHAELARQI